MVTNLNLKFVCLRKEKSKEAVSFAITYIGLNLSQLICPIMQALGP
jgi:hypothetical protein